MPIIGKGVREIRLTYPDFDGLLQLTPAQAAKTLGSLSKPFCSA